MKQPKKLTREQKECLSAHYLNCKDWMLVEETEFYYRIINKNTGTIKSVDKFRRVKRRKNHEYSYDIDYRIRCYCTSRLAVSQKP